jgi:hypothetical protein
MFVTWLVGTPDMESVVLQDTLARADARAPAPAPSTDLIAQRRRRIEDLRRDRVHAISPSPPTTAMTNASAGTAEAREVDRRQREPSPPAAAVAAAVVAVPRPKRGGEAFTVAMDDAAPPTFAAPLNFRQRRREANKLDEGRRQWEKMAERPDLPPVCAKI